MPTLTLAATFEKDIKDIVMIYADAYYLAYQLKKAQVFAISIRDLEFQAENEFRPKTNPKTVVLKEYYDLLDVFSKKTQIHFLFIKNMIIKSY